MFFFLTFTSVSLAHLVDGARGVDLRPYGQARSRAGSRKLDEDERTELCGNLDGANMASLRIRGMAAMRYVVYLRALGLNIRRCAAVGR